MTAAIIEYPDLSGVGVALMLAHGVKDEMEESNADEIGINCFGRIGRLVLRAALHDPEAEFVCMGAPRLQVRTGHQPFGNVYC